MAQLVVTILVAMVFWALPSPRKFKTRASYIRGDKYATLYGTYHLYGYALLAGKHDGTVIHFTMTIEKNRWGTPKVVMQEHTAHDYRFEGHLRFRGENAYIHLECLNHPSALTYVFNAPLHGQPLCQAVAVLSSADQEGNPITSIQLISNREMKLEEFTEIVPTRRITIVRRGEEITDIAKVVMKDGLPPGNGRERQISIKSRESSILGTGSNVHNSHSGQGRGKR